jgi:hypothetical protein
MGILINTAKKILATPMAIVTLVVWLDGVKAQACRR